MYKIIALLLSMLVLSACGGTTAVTVRHDTVTNPNVGQRHANAPGQKTLSFQYWRQLPDRNDMESELWAYYGIEATCKGEFDRRGNPTAAYCTRGGYPYGVHNISFNKLGLAGVHRGVTVIADVTYLSQKQFRSYKTKRPPHRYPRRKRRGY